MSIGAIKLSDVFVNGFVVSVLLLSTSAVLPLLYQKSGFVDPVQDDPIAQIVWLGVYAVAFLLFVVRSKQCFRVAMSDKLLLLLVGIALVSILWSAAPEATLRRSVALVGTTLFGIYLATRYDLEELLRLLAWALGIAALLSLVFALALPSYGIYSDDRGTAWQGIYAHKNVLGRAMALGIVVFLFLALGSRRYRWIAWAGVGLSIVLLLLSESLAAAVSLLTLLALLPFYRALRWHYTLVAPFFIVVVLAGGIVATWFVGNAESVLDALGRDHTLSGRTELWDAVLEMIRQRPWLGYGYGGFWLGWAGESAHVWLWSGIKVTHAHNGLLNIWLDLGLLGALVFALGFLLAFLRAVAWARLTTAAEGLWPLAYLTFVLLYSLTESSMLSYNNIFWILYVAVALSIFTKRGRTRKTGRADVALRRRTEVETVRNLL